MIGEQSLINTNRHIIPSFHLNVSIKQPPQLFRGKLLGTQDITIQNCPKSGLRADRDFQFWLNF